MVLSEGWSRWAGRLRALQAAGLVGTALAVVAQRVLHDAPLWPPPPGLLIAGGAAAVLLVWRRPFAVLVGLAAAALMAGHVLSRPAALEELGAGVRGTAEVLELVGTGLGLVAGAAALVASAVAASATGRRRPWATWAQPAGLLVLAPVCAEYLAAYDDSTGHPSALLGGLVVFVPLYGAPALLIRELARRAGLGWVGIALLATAFGLLQAGVVDESLFNADYRGIDGWEEAYGATLIAPWGLSAVNLLNFVGGHVIFSICAPIAMVEAARPAQARRPWLGRFGLVVAAVGYVAASALVLIDHRRSEGAQDSPRQLALVVVLAGMLVATAVIQGRRSRRGAGADVARQRPAVRVRTVFGVAVAGSVVHALAPNSWFGVTLTVLVLTAATVALVRGARHPGWGVRHAAAAAAAPLLVRVVLAFGYGPLLGEVSAAAALGHHLTMLAVVVVVSVAALRPVPVRPPAGTAESSLLRAGRKGP